MNNGAEPDVVMRWLTIAICLPMIVVGVLGLFKPRQYRDALLNLFGRIPDQRSTAPFVKFMSGRYFVLFVRLFSLFPLALAVTLLCTLR